MTCTIRSTMVGSCLHEPRSHPRQRPPDAPQAHHNSLSMVTSSYRMGGTKAVRHWKVSVWSGSVGLQVEGTLLNPNKWLISLVGFLLPVVLFHRHLPIPGPILRTTRLFYPFPCLSASLQFAHAGLRFTNLLLFFPMTFELFYYQHSRDPEQSG